MDFNIKLQELRKQKGLTQEELAEVLYVSRTAISKWESGRGYPNIDSLKAISKFFSVTIDELLSGDEILDIAKEEGEQKKKHLCDITFGLLDCSFAMFFFLPFLGQSIDGKIQSVPLLHFAKAAPYLQISYYTTVALMTIFGIAMLVLQAYTQKVWVKNKYLISIILNIISVILFIVSLQPYAATFVFIFLLIKVLMLIKW